MSISPFAYELILALREFLLFMALAIEFCPVVGWPKLDLCLQLKPSADYITLKNNVGSIVTLVL